MRLGEIAVAAVLCLAIGCVSRPDSPESLPQAAGSSNQGAVDAIQVQVGTAIGGSLDQAPAAQAGGRGAIAIAVRWPDYQVQTIPFSAQTLAFSLLGEAGSPVATASIVRPAAAATMSAIATGSYTLEAVAHRGDAAKTVVASASALVEVFANRVTQASLTLVPRFLPQLDFIDPPNGPPGTKVTLWGANLAPPAGGTYSVTVDGVPVPQIKLQPGSGKIVITAMPEGGGATAAIAVAVDGVSVAANQVQVFTRFVVHHIRLLPATASLTPRATTSFVAAAFQDAEEQATADLPIRFFLEDPVPAPDPLDLTAPRYAIEAGVLQTTGATGSVTVVAQAGGQEARAYVKVEAP